MDTVLRMDTVAAVAIAVTTAARVSAAAATRLVAGMLNSRLTVFVVRGRHDAVQLNRLVRVVLMESFGAVSVTHPAVVVDDLSAVRRNRNGLADGMRSRRRVRVTQRARFRIVLLVLTTQPHGPLHRLESRWLNHRCVGEPVGVVVPWLVAAVATGCRKQHDESRNQAD